MKVRRYLNLAKRPKDLWLVLRVAALAAVLPILLRCVRLPRLLRLLEARNTLSAGAAQVDRTVRFVDLVLRTRRLGSKNWCLKRSLLLYHFLGDPVCPWK